MSWKHSRTSSFYKPLLHNMCRILHHLPRCFKQYGWKKRYCCPLGVMCGITIHPVQFNWAIQWCWDNGYENYDGKPVKSHQYSADPWSRMDIWLQVSGSDSFLYSPTLTLWFLIQKFQQPLPSATKSSSNCLHGRLQNETVLQGIHRLCRIRS